MIQGRRHKLSRAHSKAFTMVEIILALGVTGMIGAAVSAMLFSVSYGTSKEADLRRVTVKEKVIALRMNNAIGSSKMVLDQGTDFMVLWMGDRRPNGTPDLSEIRRIDRDGVTLELSSYKAPSTLSDADNVTYSFHHDFDAITTALMGSANFPGEIWARNVTAWDQTLDQINPQSARLVCYAASITGNDVMGIATNTMLLRSR